MLGLVAAGLIVLGWLVERTKTDTYQALVKRVLGRRAEVFCEVSAACFLLTVNVLPACSPCAACSLLTVNVLPVRSSQPTHCLLTALVYSGVGDLVNIRSLCRVRGYMRGSSASDAFRCLDASLGTHPHHHGHSLLPLTTELNSGVIHPSGCRVTHDALCGRHGAAQLCLRCELTRPANPLRS